MLDTLKGKIKPIGKGTAKAIALGGAFLLGVVVVAIPAAAKIREMEESEKVVGRMYSSLIDAVIDLAHGKAEMTTGDTDEKEVAIIDTETDIHTLSRYKA